MSAWLRGLGIAVLALGLGFGGWAGTRAAGDAHFTEISEQYERHPDHPLFQAEYYAVASRHYTLVVGAVGGVLGGLVFGSMLLALGTLVVRTPKNR
jgi:hypothetical protein